VVEPTGAGGGAADEAGGWRLRRARPGTGIEKQSSG
jgi:hypothetical protein